MSAFELDESTTAHADGLAPPRLLDGGGDAFERLLLEPARSAHVPRASLERLARALQVPAGALPAAHGLDAGFSSGSDASSGSTSTPSTSPPSLSPATEAQRGSWLARLASRRRLGAVSAVVVGVGLAGLRMGSWGDEARAPSPPTAAVDTLARQDTPSEPELPVSSARATTPAAELPAIEADLGIAPAGALTATPPHRADAAPVRAGTPARHPAQRALRAPAVSSPPPSSGLGAELRALEAVQRALWEHQPDAAARALVEYDQRFAQGELRLEADLLGVEVALARGQLGQARARALELSALPAAARYRDRLSTLLAATENTNGAPRDDGANPRASHIKGAEVSR